MFYKYAANIQENTHVEVWFQKSSKPTLSKLHFCKFLFNMPVIFSIKIYAKFGLFSNIFLTRSVFSSERIVPRVSEFYLFLFRLVLCERNFVKFCWIAFLSGGVEMLLELLCSFIFRKIFLQQKLVLFRYLRQCNLESPPEKVFSKHFDFRAI